MDNQRTFGQVVAVFVLAPVFMEGGWLYYTGRKWRKEPWRKIGRRVRLLAMGERHRRMFFASSAQLNTQFIATESAAYGLVTIVLSPD